MLLLSLLLLPIRGVLASTLRGPPCQIPLYDDSRPCIKNCLGKMAHKQKSFVCDITADWLHHVGGSDDWFPGTPHKGTGVHEYVAYKGTPPCSQNGHCAGCRTTEVVSVRTKLCSIRIDPEDCSVYCSGDQTDQVTELFYH